MARTKMPTNSVAPPRTVSAKVVIPRAANPATICAIGLFTMLLILALGTQSPHGRRPQQRLLVLACLISVLALDGPLECCPGHTHVVNSWTPSAAHRTLAFTQAHDS